MNPLQCAPIEDSRKRRVLFPSNENSFNGSDLGCIGPLVFESNRVEQTIGDYVIIGLVDKDSTANTPQNSTHLPSNPVSKLTTPHIDFSPTQNLRTPDDISNNSKLPRLPRKTLSESGAITDTDYVIQEISKASKVRTALFPTSKMSSPSSSAPSKKSKQIQFLCQRRSKNRSGEINGGVRHKIRKPTKRHSLRKTAALRAALKVNKKDLIKENKITVPLPERHQIAAHSKKVLKPPSGVVSFNNDIEFKLSNGKMTFSVNKNKLKRSQPQESTIVKRPKLDVPIFDQEKPIESSEIAKIIETLEDKENIDKDIGLLSPTSVMCNMTSGLAIKSPKKALNLSPILDKMSSTTETNKKKLYPLFYPDNKRPALPLKTTKNVPNKRFRPLAKNQMLLDAGQKRWGVTQCEECKFVYHMGDPSDETLHANYHNAEHVFRYQGWKNERVVSNSLLDGRVIQIVPGDSKIWWKKVKDVMEAVNRDLGFYEMIHNTENSEVFFYIKNRTIIGVLVAEAKSSGHRLMTTPEDQIDLCSEEAYPIKCGVFRIWVSQMHRKQGVAKTMMESLKRNFVMGYILRNEDIAFSSPTELGKQFGKKYFKTDNFLIYFV